MDKIKDYVLKNWDWMLAALLFLLTILLPYDKVGFWGSLQAITGVLTIFSIANIVARRVLKLY